MVIFHEKSSSSWGISMEPPLGTPQSPIIDAAHRGPSANRAPSHLEKREGTCHPVSKKKHQVYHDVTTTCPSCTELIGTHRNSEPGQSGLKGLFGSK